MRGFSSYFDIPLTWGMGSCWDVAEGSIVAIPTAMVMATGEFGDFLFRWWQICFSVLFFCGALWPLDSPQTHQPVVSGLVGIGSKPIVFHIFIYTYVCMWTCFIWIIHSTHTSIVWSIIPFETNNQQPTTVSTHPMSSIGGCPKDNLLWPLESVGTRRTDFGERNRAVCWLVDVSFCVCVCVESTKFIQISSESGDLLGFPFF